MESRRDSMNWSGVDRAYNYAKQRGIPYKHHTFVWGSQAPGWINSLSQNEQKAEVEEWMRRDPIPRFRKNLIRQGTLSQIEAEEIDQKVVEAVEEAAEFAVRSPFPKPEEALENVFIKFR